MKSLILLAAASATLCLMTPARAAEEPSPVLRAAIETIENGHRDEGVQTLAVLAKNDLLAATLLGEAYYFGLWGLTPDAGRACDLFDSAKEAQGEAAHNFAMCLEQGVGRGRDLAAARLWYGKAADMGHEQARCALGNLLIDGKGGARDVPRGMALCRQAAEAGDANAQADLGNRLIEGKVVERDVIAARGWYEKAATQGQANAAFILGQIYWNGDGVARDFQQAARWWKVAWDGGRQDAALLLAQEAYVRLATALEAGAFRSDIADEAEGWYRLALKTNLSKDERKEVNDVLDLLGQLRASTHRN